jgi:hypothetical protein
MSRTAILYIMIFNLFGCQSKYVDEKELKAYVMEPKHGLIKKVEKGGIALEMLYKPVDLIVMQELDDSQNPNERLSTISKYDSLDYFILTISRRGQEIENSFVNSSQFVEVINYLGGGISEDISLVIGDEINKVLSVAYVGSFGMANKTQIMCVFNSFLLSKHGNASIHFDDSILGTGLNIFEFSIDQIKKTPRLKLN